MSTAALEQLTPEVFEPVEGLPRDVLTARKFTPEWLDGVFQDAEVFKAGERNLSARRDFAGLYAGMVVGALFRKNSTRTVGSMGAAAARLGMDFKPLNVEMSSMGKGETVEETIRTLSGQADILAIRALDDESVAEFAKHSIKPVINCGDILDHPTQGILDAYTILAKTGRLTDHRVTFFGDIKHSRAVRSTAETLALYPGNELVFVNDPEFKMEDELRDYLTAHEVPFTETNDIVAGVSGATVIVGARNQTERHGGKRSSIVYGDAARKATPADAIIMHSLPHNEEISEWVVANEPRSVINEQQDNGVWSRMAIYHDIMMREFKAPPLWKALPASVLPELRLVPA